MLLHVLRKNHKLISICYHVARICYNLGYFMLHVLRTVGATGWLVSQKVLSLLWLAILSPGYCPYPCVCTLPVPFDKLGICSVRLALIPLCLGYSFSTQQRMCYFNFFFSIDQTMLNERSISVHRHNGRLTRLFHEGMNV